MVLFVLTAQLTITGITCSPICASKTILTTILNSLSSYLAPSVSRDVSILAGPVGPIDFFFCSVRNQGTLLDSSLELYLN